MNIRVALRPFIRQPLYAFSVAATLALAVAAATATCAVVKRAFLDPLPYADPEKLVSILTVIDGETWPISAPVFEDLRAAGAPIVDYAPIDPEGVTVTDSQSSEQLPAAYVTPSYFSTLGVSPALGRPLDAGSRQQAVVSYTFSQQRLGGADHALGRTVRINGIDYAVVGVMPDGFVPPYFTTTVLWLPLDIQPLLAGSGRARRPLNVVARLAPGTSLESLNARLEPFTKQLQLQHPQIHGRQSWTAKDLREELVGTAQPVLLGTGAAAALLLLLVFANIAGLSGARAVGMRHQIAVRVALGATRARLWRERLAESLAVAFVGSIAGIWLGSLLIDLVSTFQMQFMPRLAPVSLDWWTAGAGLAAGLLSGVIAAILPQGTFAVAGAIDALRSARSSSGGVGVARVRSALVVMQVALALVLLVGAGLLVRTVHHLSSAALGFDPENLTTFTTSMPTPKYREEERQLQFERDVLERLRAIPGVRAAVASVGFPVVGGVRASLSIEGRSDAGGRGEIAYMSMSPDFRHAVGMRLLSGRDLAPSDTSKAPLVVVINETMARHHWPQGDALGATVRIGPGTGGPLITVVGIVADVRYHGPTQPVIPAAFGSTLQYSWPRRHFSVRSEGPSAALAAEIRAALRAADPDVPLGPFQTVADMVANQTSRHRLVMIVLTFFGGVATVLCAFGLYAVVALTSQMRRREYAIRLALGAPRGNVRWTVVRQSLILAGTGVVIGIGVARAGTRVLTGLLHGVTAVDTATFGAACATVMALTLLAASLPARAAGRVDPIEALEK
jgi:predicted permease